MHPDTGAGCGAPSAVGEHWLRAGAWCALLGRRARTRAIRSWVKNTREGLAAQTALSLQDPAPGQDGERRQRDAEEVVRLLLPAGSGTPGRAGTGVPRLAPMREAPRLADSGFSCVSFCFLIPASAEKLFRDIHTAPGPAVLD